MRVMVGAREIASLLSDAGRYLLVMHCCVRGAHQKRCCYGAGVLAGAAAGVAAGVAAGAAAGVAAGVLPDVVLVDAEAVDLLSVL